MSRLDAYRTLLLDSSFLPLRTISWQRAVVLGLQQRVDVVETYERGVHTPSRVIPLPAVVRIRQYLKVTSRGVAFTRRNVLARDRFQCQYCGCRPPVSELTLDHVHPRSRGGKMTWENVVAACRPCNHKKGARTPSEARMRLMRAPTRPLFLRSRFRVRDPAAHPHEWSRYLVCAG